MRKEKRGERREKREEKREERGEKGGESRRVRGREHELTGGAVNPDTV